MKRFVLDLWHDLRTKRLAPVAVILAAALVAVPLLVLKPVSEPPPAPAPAPKAAPAAAQLPQLKSISAVAETAGARGGSTLSAFNNKDPFKPPAVVLNAKRDEAGATASAPKSAAAAADSGGSGDSGSQGGSAGGLTTPPSTTPPARPRRRSRAHSPTRPTCASGAAAGRVATAGCVSSSRCPASATRC